MFAILRLGSKSFRVIAIVLLSMLALVAPFPAHADGETPTGVTISQGDSPLSMKVTWTKPTFTTGMVGYEVFLYPEGNPGNSAMYSTPNVDATEYTFSSTTELTITQATLYLATVKSKFGSSYFAATAASSAKALGTPDAPSSVEAERTDSGEITVTWVAPAETGGESIARYNVTCSPVCSAGEIGAQATSTSDTSLTITNLDRTTARTFTVTASNSKYTSSASTVSNSVTPYLPPSMPTSITATPGNAKVDVTWGESTVTGSTITGYQVSIYAATDADFASPLGTKNLTNAQVASGKKTSFTSGLTNGQTYLVRVAGVAGANPGTDGAVVGSYRVSSELTPTAPVVSSAAKVATPSAKVGSKLAGTKVTSLLNIKVPAKAKVSLKVASGMSKICKISKGKLQLLKKGTTCKLTVTVTPKKGKAVKYKNKLIKIS